MSNTASPPRRVPAAVAASPRLAGRPAVSAKRGRLLAVASGKGGVGKTFFSITLCHALARRGQRTLLFDGDLGLANIDIQLGLMPQCPSTISAASSPASCRSTRRPCNTSRAASRASWATSIEIMRDGLTADVRIRAATALLDRGWGRPAQQLSAELNAPQAIIVNLGWFKGRKVQQDVPYDGWQNGPGNTTALGGPKVGRS